MSTAPEVTILLATYQGERHLPAQLDSIAAQRGVEWNLLWRDDGSTDGTVALLEAFAASTGRAYRLNAPSGRLGPAGSFMALLRAAGEAEFAAFCDQDDVWLPDKLARATAWLRARPRTEPAAYCARQRLVDAGLAPIGLSALPRRPPGFANALVQNIATGCTMVLNAAARRLAAATPLPRDSMHDWWGYLLVTGCGGRLLVDPEPAVLYRQHGGNAIGAPGTAVRAWRAALRGPAPFHHLLRQHLDALRSAPLTAEALACTEALRGLGASDPVRRLVALRRAGVYRQDAAETALLHVWAALGRMDRALAEAAAA